MITEIRMLYLKHHLKGHIEMKVLEDCKSPKDRSEEGDFIQFGFELIDDDASGSPHLSFCVPTGQNWLFWNY